MSFAKAFAVILLSFVACNISTAQDSFWSQYDGMFDYEIQVARSPGFQILAEFTNPLSNPITGSAFHHKLFDNSHEMRNYQAANLQLDLVEQVRFLTYNRKKMVVALAPTWNSAQERAEWIRQQNRDLQGSIEIRIMPVLDRPYVVQGTSGLQQTAGK